MLAVLVARLTSACTVVQSDPATLTRTMKGFIVSSEQVADRRVRLEVGKVGRFCRVSAWPLHMEGLMIVLKVSRSCSGGIMLREKEVRDGWAVREGERGREGGREEGGEREGERGQDGWEGGEGREGACYQASCS